MRTRGACSTARSCGRFRSGATTTAPRDAPWTWRSRSGGDWAPAYAGATNSTAYSGANIARLSGRDELQHHPPGARAFLLDLRHAQPPDLARVGHVGAATRLQVDPVDLEQAHAPDAPRRFHRHRAHEVG